MSIKIGDKVKLTKSIWDDGQDHSPPGWLAQKGEILIVRKVNPKSIDVSHEEITNNSFYITRDEYELIPSGRENDNE